jgi:hypothetical protein
MGSLQQGSHPGKVPRSAQSMKHEHEMKVKALQKGDRMRHCLVRALGLAGTGMMP